VDAESVARKTLGFEQFVDVLHKEGIEQGHGKFDVTEMAGTEVHRHAASNACRFVIKGRNAKGFRVQSILCRIVQVVKCYWVNDLLYANLFDF